MTLPADANIRRRVQRCAASALSTRGAVTVMRTFTPKMSTHGDVTAVSGPQGEHLAPPTVWSYPHHVMS